jgi:hypothetical protein
MPVIFGAVVVGEAVACLLFTLWNGFSLRRTAVDIRGNFWLWTGTSLVVALGVWLIIYGRGQQLAFLPWD